MKPFFFALVLSIPVLGCACPPLLAPPDEVDPQCGACVAGCLRLGMLVETADAGNPFGLLATCRMEYRLQQRAERLKATHILWLHRTPYSAAAEAYRCPIP